MPRSFSSALSGMRAHQQWIDLIGNNLANTNTVSLKHRTMHSRFGTFISNWNFCGYAYRLIFKRAVI